MAKVYRLTGTMSWFPSLLGNTGTATRHGLAATGSRCPRSNSGGRLPCSTVCLPTVPDSTRMLSTYGKKKQKKRYNYN